MAPSSCVDLSTSERAQLLQIARESVRSGLDSSISVKLSLQDLPQAHRIKRAVFVTLSKRGRLRGCIGSLAASEPLANALESLPVSSRGDLLTALQPQRDGLLLQDGQHRATFLPHVWQQLPDPDDFFNHLLTKAGLPIGYWSANLTFFRYRTLSFSEASSALPHSE